MNEFQRGFQEELEKIAFAVSRVTRKPAGEILSLIKRTPTLVHGRAEVSELQKAMRAAKGAGKDPYTEPAVLTALQKAQKVAV